MKQSHILIGACAVAIVAAVYVLQSRSTTETATLASGTGGPIVEVMLPAIEGNAAIGKSIFDRACASCHGANAVGIDGTAPPLVHKIYEPSHHSDEAFQRAVAGGVTSHHWPFGNMPPVERLTRGDVKMIVAYIRELQRANGIR